MLIKRAITLLVLSLSLSACWLSDEPLLSADDFATTGLSGEYRQTVFSERAAKLEKVRFTPQADGSIKITTNPNEKRPDFVSTVGQVAFVPIPDRPSGWYIAIEVKPSGRTGEGYMIALAKKGILRVYQPDCRGTAQRDGLALVPTPASPGAVCNFQSKEALLSAAQEAVDFLIAKQIIAVTPLIEFRPVPEFLDRPSPAPDPSR